MSDVTYHIRMRLTVEQELEVDVAAATVEEAIESALRGAKAPYNQAEAIVDAWVVGNIHGSDGSLWI